MNRDLIVLSESEVATRLSSKLVLDAVQSALIAAVDGSARIYPVVIGGGLNEGEVFSIKSAATSSRRIVGLKVGTYWPRNLAARMACHGSTILLLDPDTGRLVAVVEASRLNGPRTAAADAIAARTLARADSHTLMVIGAGHQAEFEIRALCAILPIRRILIASRSAQRAANLSGKLLSDLEIDTEAVEIERGCREADIVVTATPARAPLFNLEWLKPGTHVATMGSDQPGKQELPPDLLRRARLFCDMPAQALAVGEFQHVRAEVESGEIILTALGDVLVGRAEGRRSLEEITVFDSSGLALQDLFVAASLLHHVSE